MYEELNKNIRKFTFNVFSRRLLSINVIFFVLVVVLWVIFQNYLYNKFVADYYIKSVRNIEKELAAVSVTNKEYINRIIEKNLSDRWIKGIWLTDKNNILIAHSSRQIMNKYLNLKYKNKDFSGYKLWKFDNNGDVIPVVKKNLKWNSIDVIFPVYNNRDIKYICGVRFSRYIIAPFLFPELDVPVYFYIIEVIIIGFILVSLFFIINIIVLKKISAREEHKVRDSIAWLYKIPIDDINYSIEFDKKYKHNIFAEYIRFINYILDYYHTRIKHLIEKDIKLRKITSPLIVNDIDAEKKIETVNIVVRPDEKDINKYLTGLYYNEKEFKPVKNFSWSVYHYGKDEDKDIIIKFVDILGNRKGFFLLDIEEIKNRRFLLEFLNYYLTKKQKNISNTSGYLTELNNFIHRFGETELWFHSMYFLLDTETNYIEISATKFSPVILFKREDNEAYYYNFEGIALGKRDSANFQKALKKEVFRLGQGDIILIMNKEFEKLKNYDKVEFELYKIINILKENPDTPAEVLKEKIVNKMIDFGVDFSLYKELFLFILKRD